MNEHGIVDGSIYVKSDIWGGKRAANYYLGGDILRIDVCIALDDELMPADYRRIFLSLFKHAMQEYSEKKLLYYFGGEAMKKNYCWAVNLPGAKFSGDTVTLSKSELTLRFSTPDAAVFSDFYNALNAIRGKAYSHNGVTMCIKDIFMPPMNRVTSGSITAHMISPLVLREHDAKTNKDVYFTAESEDFEIRLRDTVRNRLNDFCEDAALADTLEVLDVSRARRTVIRYYGMKFHATIGDIVLRGDPKLLEWMRLIGIGSHCSAGFGMFNAVERRYDNG